VKTKLQKMTQIIWQTQQNCHYTQAG